MHFQTIQDSFKIDLFEITQGCPENCEHCGAYDKKRSKEDLQIRALSGKQIETLLQENIRGSAMRVVDYANTFVTTQVNSEPLRSDAFFDFANSIFHLSGKRSRAVFISHGVRADIPEMSERLKNIIQLTHAGVLQNIIITVDSARSNGSIGALANREGYRQTLKIVQSAAAGARLTLSVQGESAPEHHNAFVKNMRMIRSLIKKTGGSERFMIDERISYAPAGRSQDRCNDMYCDVIPDAAFMRDCVPTGHYWRGMMRFDGTVVVQPNRPGKTYNDSVAPELWTPV
ncbi:hypothetical protein COV82_03840 [Candidatus Peregrinibacteria bacterium CG11_big_fil_rev_8_21_14_0_20_46_8]|nr:MAG: hypothetical protein COV82_03840 [Candidatus Peregrinibacteria bacterium CG11_big_fil_rev_8_21_14_0_20_46_8]